LRRTLPAVAKGVPHNVDENHKLIPIKYTVEPLRQIRTKAVGSARPGMRPNGPDKVID
jgi:hypothetical protein